MSETKPAPVPTPSPAPTPAARVWTPVEITPTFERDRAASQARQDADPFARITR